MTLDEVRKKLEDRNLQKVAKLAGIGRATIYRIIEGKAVRAATLEKLVAYLSK